MYKTKEEIEKWLTTYKVENYTINEDLTVDVNDNVDLSRNYLTGIPIQFNIVTGNFNCNNNKLKTLKGCPKEIIGSFFCNLNKLKNLKYGPELVSGNYACNKNELISLEGSPKIIGGTFSVNLNLLKNLKFMPEKIGLGATFLNNKLNHISSKDFYKVNANIMIFDNSVVNENLLNKIIETIPQESPNCIMLNAKDLKSILLEDEFNYKLIQQNDRTIKKNKI